jgi:hypothetical protein
MRRSRPPRSKLLLAIAGCTALTAIAFAQPACAHGGGNWYITQLRGRSPGSDSVPSLREYKREFSTILPGYFSTPQQCKSAKDNFINPLLVTYELELCDRQGLGPEACKKRITLFVNLLQKAWQCVSDSDPRWRGLSPEHRWFLFWGVNLWAGTCRSRSEIVQDPIAALSSRSNEKSCEERGREMANRILGKPGERALPVPNCMYCIRGDDQILRAR